MDEKAHLKLGFNLSVTKMLVIMIMFMLNQSSEILINGFIFALSYRPFINVKSYADTSIGSLGLNGTQKRKSTFYRQKTFREIS
jgi:hypothetical protein